jgi:GrpB-like predicted nucleotidyltransferase (UPF0157 family)
LAVVVSDDAAELHEALGASLLALEHVGSTAVPFLAAKPVIFWSPLEPGHYPATTDESSRAWGTNTLVKLAFPVAAARAWRGRY